MSTLKRTIYPLSSLSFFLSLWDLTLEEPPFQTKTGLIAYVRWKDQPCILKMGSEKGDERTSSVLRYYDGQGAVQVIKSKKNATLLERALPGNALSTLVLQGEDGRATEILCDVIQKLHSSKKFSESYLSIKEFQHSFEKYVASKDIQIPFSLVEEGEAFYRSLIVSQQDPILLHGDLHHDNVLYDRKRGWLAIDPKGYIGEPAFEVGAMLRNPRSYPELYQDSDQISRRLSLICERLGFERERVMAWAFSQAVLAAIWSVEDKESPQWAVSIALKLKKFLS